MKKKYFFLANYFELFRIAEHKKSFGLLSFFILLAGLNYSFAQSTYSLSRFDYSWCTNVYPTPYVTGSFSIIETSTANSGQDGFTKNQSNKTIIIDLPAGFEFNTASATSTVVATQSGGGAMELTGISFAFTSTTRITVTLTSANSNNNLNTLDFNNFEIKAMYSGASGSILRNGGTFQMQQLTTNPTASEPLGILSSGTPYTYTSSTVTQPNTANITQFSINQEIICIKISGTGNCNATVTQFNFNTDGGNGTGSDLPGTNISTAKVYYTGSSSTFSTTGFFGSVSSPNGAFTITGSQSLTTADSYFWLTYDVPGNANTASGSNKLDAQLVSFVLGGVTKTDMSTPAPAGSRTIIGATYYYLISPGGNWNTTSIWSYTSKGSSCSCVPNGSGVVVIDTNLTVNANLATTVDVIDIKDGATLNGGGSALTVNSSLVTSGSGKFTLNASLNVLGNVTLAGSGASTNSKLIDINGDLTIGSGTSMTCSGGTSAGVDQDIYIGGNLYVDGTLQQSGGKDIILDVGAAFVISGTGTVTTTRSFIMNSGSKSVTSGSNLTINSDFSIQGAYTLTNNGTINLNGNLDGNNASAKWTNADGSALNYAGSSTIFLTNGTLLCSAATNTVTYNGSTAQTIRYPGIDGTYNNLTLSGSLTKTLAADILVSGNLLIFTTFAHNNMGITFTGTSDQTVSAITAPTFYDFTLNKSSGTVTLSTAATVANTLNLTSGVLDLNSNTVTVSNGATTAVTRTSGYIISEKTNNSSKLKWNIGSTTGSHVYPFATVSGSYIPVTFNLTAGTIGNVSISTYPTAADNTPYPTTVSHVNSTTGSDNSANTVDRFWQIDKDGASGTATMTLNATAAEVGTITTLQAQRWNSGQTGWEPALAGQTSTATSVTVPGVSTFSPWAISGNGFPLPIQLLYFEATACNRLVCLDWSTATELNNKFFTVERSKDGITFEEVTQMPGKGTTNVQHSYYTVDANPYLGDSYYRLKQTDFDGSFEYSGIKMVTVDFTPVLIYPNPSSSGQHSITLQINGTVKAGSKMNIYDMQGKTLKSYNIFLSSTSLEMNLTPGTYYAEVVNGNEVQRQKLIIE